MADESLRTTLGFDAQQAITTLQALTTGLESYTAAMRKAASATRSYNKSAMGVDAQLQKNAKAAGVLTTATKQQSTALQSSGKQIATAKQKLQTLENQTKKTGQQMILSWQSVIRIFTIQVIHQMISKATSSMSEATRAAMGLEIQLAEIQTIGGPLKNDFEGLSEEVRGLSDAFGISAELVAEGVYQTLSNQVARASESFTFFATAADFSIAAVTSADAAVNLLSSTVNAFGYNASQATLIGAKLFKTIELGRIRGEEFANTFGRIAVLASRLGISLDQVLASIATLTISGLRYNEAFTLINNVMLKLIRPTDALKEAFGSLGIVTVEAGIQAYGFQGLLGKLAEISGDSATEMGKLFGRVRAVRGALGLTGEAAKKYAKNLKAIQAAGPETLFEAKKLIFETNAKQIQLEIESLRNAVVFDFGRRVLEILNNLIEAFGGLRKMVTALGQGVVFAGGSFALLLAAAHPIGAAVFGITSAVIGLTYAWNELSKTGEERIQDRLDTQKRAIIEINAAEAKAAEARISYFKGEFAVLQRNLLERLAAVHTIKQNAIEIEAFLTSNLHQQLDDRKSAFDRFVQSITKSMDRAKENIKKAHKTIFGIQRKLAQEVFEGQTSSYTEAQKIQANMKRAFELAGKAASEYRKGHQERAEALFTETEQLLNQAKATAQSTGNARLERLARKRITDVLQEQVGLKQRFIKAEQSRAQALKEQLPIESARARRISILIEKIKKFALFTKQGVMSFGTKEEAMAAIMPTLKAIQGEFDAAGYKLNIFKRLEETGKTDLQGALTAAMAPLETIFGKEVSLQFAYKDRIDQVFVDIQNVADQIPIDIKLRLEDLGFDVSTLKGIEDASKGLVEVFQSIERSVRATASLKGQQKTLKEQIIGVKDAANLVINPLEKQVKTLDQIRSRAELILEYNRSRSMSEENVRKNLDSVNKKLAEQESLHEQIERAATLAQEQITGTFDPTKWGYALASLEGTASELQKIGETEAAQSIMFLIQKLTEAGETAQHVGAITKGTEIQFGAEGIKKLEEVFQQQKEIANDTVEVFGSIGTAAQSAATTGNTAFDSMLGRLQTLKIQAQQTAVAIASVSGGAAVPARFGRMIYRQYGGYTPQSTDTIPAMLSPGEFVVNAQSTRKFYSQLLAMNAGVRPSFRREGGSTTTIGDVNITVQGASTPKQTAREMIYAFRRETRRGTSKL